MITRLATVLLLMGLSVQTERGTVEGVVRAMGTSAPIADAEVTAYPISTSGGATTAKTNAEGRFSLSLNPGSYRLTASQTGYVSQSLGQRSPSSFGVPVQLQAGQKIDDVAFRLVPTGTIAGRVYDPDGRPMEGVSISILKRGWDANGRRTLVANGISFRDITSNDLGEYRAYWLPPGDYYVSARDSSGNAIAGPVIGTGRLQKYATTYFPGLTDPNQASAVTVAPGSEIRGIDFSVTTTRMVTVRGRVISPPASALAVTNLFMSPVDPASYAEHGPINYNDAAQTFVIPNVMPGRYRLVAALRIPNDHNLSGETLVDVGEDPVNNVVLTVVPGQTVRGAVRFEDSLGPARELLQSKKLLVALRGDPGIGFIDQSGEIQEDGAFAVADVGSVSYRVGVFGLPPDFYVASAHMSGVDLLDRGGLRLASIVTGPLEISVSGLGGRIDGRVVGPDNQGIADARALLIPSEPLRHRRELFRMVPSDGSGYFNMRGVPPGEYRLIALDELPPGAQYDSEFLRPLEARAKPFNVEKNDRIEIALTITRPAGFDDKDFSGRVQKH